jgi:hypothetical protein
MKNYRNSNNKKHQEQSFVGREGERGEGIENKRKRRRRKGDLSFAVAAYKNKTFFLGLIN